MATRPRILLNAGHRNTSGGAAEEVARTPNLARAYRDTFRAAGYDAQWLQEIDGDSDPDDTSGSLDKVSRLEHDWIERIAGPTILLDLHFEGTSSGVRGVFSIAPNKAGLRTAAPYPQLATDIWEYNTLDRRLGKQIAANIAVVTGIPVRGGLREPGVMDERATGVGGQGYRLATFAYTSPFQERCVRLVIEHGNLPNAQDKAIIDAPGFYEKAARAAVDAVNSVYGITSQPPATTPPPDVTYVKPQPSRKGSFIRDDGYVFLAPGGKKVRKAAPPQLWADAKSPATGPDFPVGFEITQEQIKHYLVGTDGQQWIELDGVELDGIDVSGSRFPAKALIAT